MALLHTVLNCFRLLLTGPDIWNKLPPSIRESSSLTIFKISLKAHLFTAYD